MNIHIRVLSHAQTYAGAAQQMHSSTRTAPVLRRILKAQVSFTKEPYKNRGSFAKETDF